MNPGAGNLVAGQNERTTSDNLACRDLSLYRQKNCALVVNLHEREPKTWLA